MTSNRAERGRPGGYIDEDVTPDREGSLQSQVGSEGSSEAQLGEGQTAPVSPASVDDLTGAIDELQLAQTQARCDAVVKAVASRRTRRVRTRGRTTVVSRCSLGHTCGWCLPSDNAPTHGSP